MLSQDCGSGLPHSKVLCSDKIALQSAGVPLTFSQSTGRRAHPVNHDAVAGQACRRMRIAISDTGTLSKGTDALQPIESTKSAIAGHPPYAAVRMITDHFSRSFLPERISPKGEPV